MSFKTVPRDHVPKIQRNQGRVDNLESLPANSNGNSIPTNQFNEANPLRELT